MVIFAEGQKYYGKCAARHTRMRIEGGAGGSEKGGVRRGETGEEARLEDQRTDGVGRRE